MAFATSSFTSSKSNSTTSDPLYWFDVNSNMYLGLHETVEAIKLGYCSGFGTDCAKGYDDIDIDNEENVTPVGEVRAEVEKE